MAMTLNPKIIRELENLEKEPEISKSAFTALRSLVQRLDSRTIPLFLAHVSQCQGLQSSSAESIVLLFETLAKVHGHDLLLHIDSIMDIIMKALLSSSGSTKLHQACSKVILAITHNGMKKTSMPSTEKNRIINSLCKPLSDCLMSIQENAASGAALCLNELVCSNKWRFASTDLVNEVCEKVAGALEEKHMQTYNHLILVQVLCVHNAPIIEAYASSLIRSGLHILTTNVKEVKSQNRLSAIQMINLLMKSVDSRSISFELDNIIGVLRQFQKDSMPFVGKAASEALRTAKMKSRRKGARRSSLSNSLTGSSFDSSSTASEEHEDKSFSGLNSPELGPIDSSLGYNKLVDSSLSEWQCSQDFEHMGERMLSSDNSSSMDIKLDDSLLSSAADTLFGKSAIHLEQSSYGEELIHSYPISSDANDDVVEGKDGKILEEQASFDQNYMNLVLDLQDSSYNIDVGEREIRESIPKPSGKQQIQDTHLAINSLMLASSTSQAEEVHKEESKLSKFQVYIDGISLDPRRALDEQVSSFKHEETKSSETVQKFDEQQHQVQDAHLATNAPELISSTADSEATDIERSGLTKHLTVTDGIPLDFVGSLNVQDSSLNFEAEETKESINLLIDQHESQNNCFATDGSELISSTYYAETVNRECNELPNFPVSLDETSWNLRVELEVKSVQDSSLKFYAEEKEKPESIQNLNDRPQVQESYLVRGATESLLYPDAKVTDSDTSDLPNSVLLDSVSSDPIEAINMHASIFNLYSEERDNLATDVTNLMSYACGAEAVDAEKKDQHILHGFVDGTSSKLAGSIEMEDSSVNFDVQVRSSESIQMSIEQQQIHDNHLAANTPVLISSASDAEVVDIEGSNLPESSVSIDGNSSDLIGTLDLQDISLDFNGERKNPESIHKLNDEQYFHDSDSATDDPELISSKSDHEGTDREGSDLSTLPALTDDISSDPVMALHVQKLLLDYEVEETEDLEGFPKLNYQPQIQGTHLVANDADLISSNCAAETVDIEDSGSSKFQVFIDDISLNLTKAFFVHNSSCNFGVEAVDSESTQKLNDQQKMQDTTITTDATKFISFCHTKVIDGEAGKLSKLQDFTEMVAFDVQDSFCKFDAEETISSESIQKLNDQLPMQNTNFATDATNLKSLCGTKVIDEEGGKLSKGQDFTELVALDVQDSFCKFDVENIKSSEIIQKPNDQLQIHDPNLTIDAIKLFYMCDTKGIDEEDGELSNLQDSKAAAAALVVQDSFYKFDVKETKRSESIQKLNDQLQIQTDVLYREAEFQKRKRLRTLRIVNSDLASGATKLVPSGWNAKVLNRESSKSSESESTRPLDKENSSCNLIGRIKERKNTEYIQVHDNQQKVQNTRLVACKAQVLGREGSEPSASQVFIDDCCSNQIDVSAIESSSDNLMVEVETTINSEITQELNKQQEAQMYLSSPSTIELVLCNNVAEVFPNKSSMASNEEDTSCNLIDQTFTDKTDLADDGVLSASGSNGSNDQNNLSETSSQVKEVHTCAKIKKKSNYSKHTLSYICCIFVLLLALVLVPQHMEVNELSEVIPT